MSPDKENAVSDQDGICAPLLDVPFTLRSARDDNFSQEYLSTVVTNHVQNNADTQKLVLHRILQSTTCSRVVRGVWLAQKLSI
ncbi:MAG: hypothetical protein LBP35_04205 [Candidatus Ancillula trichonymphae]|nr:hypothetical protein [Candidatus Ancillula trichonymphae]